MRLQRSIRAMKLPVLAAIVAALLACPLTLLFARVGVIQPPLFELSIGSVGITTQGETTYSSRQPIRTFYGVWVFVDQRFLHQLVRIEIPNDGQPIRWQGCRLAVQRSVIAECRPASRR
jgi:hypothetical protein